MSLLSAGPTRPTDFVQKTLTLPTIGAVTVEQYRTLALSLEQAEPRGTHRVVLITSALASEGKTLTATNLAFALSASYHRRVLLIDGDLRRPSLNALVDALGAHAGDQHAVQLPEGHLPAAKLTQVRPKLHVLSLCDGPAADPIATLNSPELTRLLTWARETFDWVVIDSPPAALVPDAQILAHLADGVLMVIWATTTPYEAARQAVASLGRDRLLGVVMNRVPRETSEGALRYYASYESYG